MRPTLYEFAGGEHAFLAFAAALHARCPGNRRLRLEGGNRVLPTGKTANPETIHFR